ncbi:unnamed protein product [Ranitomeya imitator]|uniref:Uncharacterized protein n=1 Tax=Ranitomeya imitator TaxID=111125 RepID=A0ABN9KYH0_9NEOB|nr:unnamed protein product [Ranitomeya imitator]
MPADFQGDYCSLYQNGNFGSFTGSRTRVPPPEIKAHSTRAVGASSAVRHRVIADGFASGTWSSIHTFRRTTADSSLGRRILQAAVWQQHTPMVPVSPNEGSEKQILRDEELEDTKALLYLPIAPEVEDPEENPYGPPPDAGQMPLTEDGTGTEKKRQASSDAAPPPKKKPKTTMVELQGVPTDEVHPLLGVKGDSKSKKKQSGRPKGAKGGGAISELL